MGSVVSGWIDSLTSSPCPADRVVMTPLHSVQHFVGLLLAGELFSLEGLQKHKSVTRDREGERGT